EVATKYRTLQEQGTLKLHQLWFLKHRDASTEEARIKLAVLEATNALEGRMAELRRVEAELEHVRQAHYESSDELHAAQGALAEANLEVSRLEERIRYVVEGRQRLEQRLAELKGQNEQWSERRASAEFELETLAEKMAVAEEQAEVQAAQAEELAGNLPTFEDAVRAASQRANEQRGVAGQVQQQIQLLAAESRNVEDQSRQLNQRRERLATEKQGLAAPDDQRLAEMKAQLAQRQEEFAVLEAQLAELSEQVPLLDDARKQQQQEANAQSARQSEL